uniref:Uncharacterized protein n=1 Tax=Solanum lycopersicum TaxID=4081 RepID=A0A3Q7H8Y3_SOLLC
MALPINIQTSLSVHLPYETINLLSPSSFLRSPITDQTTSEGNPRFSTMLKFSLLAGRNSPLKCIKNRIEEKSL